MTTIAMQAPSGRTGVVQSSVTLQNYLIDANGVVSADSRDVPTLLAAGFTMAPRATEAVTALATVGAGTITAAGIAGGVSARGGAQSATAFTDTTATADLIIAAVPGAAIGQSWEWTYRNNTDGPATITGGTGVTVSGNTLVQPNSWVRYLVTYTAASTITIASVAAGANTPQAHEGIVTTADGGSSATLTAAMVTGADLVFHTSAGGSTPSLQFPTAANIIAAIPGWQIGQSYVLRIINTNSGNATMTTNTGLTLTGTMTLATNTFRDFLVAYSATGAVTITSVGTGATS